MKRLFCSILLALLPAYADAEQRPNFIVIMADDLGYGDLGCYGNSTIQTPHLDQLARDGLRFTDFHSSGAVCSPTRAGLVTGRYQQRAGISTVIFADPKRPSHPYGIQPHEVTFAEQLATAGYQTAIFGKWHLGYYKKYNPVRHGFQTFRGYISGNVDFFTHIDQAGRLDWWRDDDLEDEPGYTTHLITRYALDFLEENSQKPFCLYLPYEPPHYPYQGPKDPPVRSVGQPRGPAETQQSPDDIRRAYREMVEEMDRGIGQIVSTLRRLRIANRTLVLFFSDNGANARGSNGRLRGNKGQLWEGGHRVPCIAWWPDTIAAGNTTDELTISIDVMPTLLEAAGVAPSPHRKLDGVSWLRLLTDNQPLKERRLYWGFGNARAVREGPWKLIKPSAGATPRLYHLEDDLSETKDLAEVEVERTDKLVQALAAWDHEMAATAAPQPVAPPSDNR